MYNLTASAPGASAAPCTASARDDALLRYRRSLSSAWRNSCYFLDAEPAAKRYPEVTFVRYGDRGPVSEAKRADAGAAKLASLAETNKKQAGAALGVCSVFGSLLPETCFIHSRRWMV